MDAAAQDMIAEVLGAYHYTQDRLAQIVATQEQSHGLQRAQHQETMEQWKLHNTTMATITGALLHLAPTQAETPTDQEAPTTGQNTAQLTTAAAATGLVPPSEDTQETCTSTCTDQHQAPKRSLRPRYGTGIPAKTKARSKK
ncbi:hypothetical protein NDU88_008464 [Pleurodeles waltl]|uniref:Uncharacterized protein n=1 Tax=Pleurodeles waltl TaxID=8319 RepID=A0AAV7RXQ9_PLEWA|nr:hypothetical protein NDU88_008464 [Pleurodeles waltl]